MVGWSHGESGGWSSLQHANRAEAGLQRRIENAKKLYLLLMSINKERPISERWSLYAKLRRSKSTEWMDYYGLSTMR